MAKKEPDAQSMMEDSLSMADFIKKSGREGFEKIKKWNRENPPVREVRYVYDVMDDDTKIYKVMGIWLDGDGNFILIDKYDGKRYDPCMARTLQKEVFEAMASISDDQKEQER